MRAPQYGHNKGKRRCTVTPPRETFAKPNRPARDHARSRNDRRSYAWDNRRALPVGIDNGPRQPRGILCTS